MDWFISNLLGGIKLKVAREDAERPGNPEPAIPEMIRC